MGDATMSAEANETVNSRFRETGEPAEKEYTLASHRYLSAVQLISLMYNSTAPVPLKALSEDAVDSEILAASLREPGENIPYSQLRTELDL